MDASDIKSDPNRHVREYLEYYVAFEQAPRYAVLLSGKWGAGKTYQARKILDDLFPAAGELDRTLHPLKKIWASARKQDSKVDSKRYIIVSLYGLKSPQEIDDAMVAALYPWSDNDGVRIATSVGKAILKHAKIELPKLKSSDLVNKMSADVFIFDDLERCAMKVTDAFGYINQLVERDGCKVIVLANEDEIPDQEKYRIGKEKLIGKTLTVEPDYDAAFATFIDSVKDATTKAHLEKSQHEIRNIYDQSQLKNLRILQQTMWDFERVYRAIRPLHRDNHDAMDHLLKLLFVLCFEHKSGALSAEDLARRSSRSLEGFFDNNKPPGPLQIAGQKYPGFYIFDSMLSDQVCYDILVRGMVDADAIASSLNESSWFVSTDEPSWVTVWRSFERSDAEAEVAARNMIGEFEARNYKLTGEILHVFGLMLRLADLGFSGRDRAQTVSDCKAYIDDLRARNELEGPKEYILDDIRYGSYRGLGFSQNDTVEFRELWTYVAEQRGKAEEDRYADQAANLIVLMKCDPSDFVGQIAYHRDGTATYANRPVLAGIDAEAFADSMIGLEPIAFREVLLGLGARYDMAKLAKGRELEGERDWANALEKALLDRASGLGPFARDRICKNVKWTLGKRLAELRQVEKELDENPEIPQ